MIRKMSSHICGKAREGRDSVPSTLYVFWSLVFLCDSFFPQHSSSSVLSETVDFYDLVERDGLLYKKFTDVPFTGEVKGQTGRVKDGKREGEWVSYHKNGLLQSKGTYRNGKEEREYVSYHDNGQLWFKGTYRNGKREDLWKSYNRYGVKDELAGFYKNGEKVSD
tara:strand:+ start:190 stop:684 length:495 start_codon:yes stop_codon:yes gene_type:complete